MSENETTKKQNNRRKHKWIIPVVLASVLIFFGVKYILKQREQERIRRNKTEAFGKYNKIGEFGAWGTPDLALVELKVDGEIRYGFINRSYEEVIPCKFVKVNKFFIGVAVSKLDNMFVLLDTSGDMTQLKYTDIDDFSEESFARAEIRDEKGVRYCYINRQGRERGPYYDYLPNLTDSGDWDCCQDVCLAKARRDGKYGFINKQRHEVIECKYDDIKGYGAPWFDENGLVIVKYLNSYGCINRKGQEVIPIMYEYISHYTSHNRKVYEVKYDGKYGYFDVSRNGFVINCIYDEPFSFPKDDEIIRVKRDGKIGYIDSDGFEEIPAVYDDIYDQGRRIGLCKDRIRVKKDGKFGFIDENGSEVIPCIYDNAGDFYNDTKQARVKKDGRYFYIDLHGKAL